MDAKNKRNVGKSTPLASSLEITGEYGCLRGRDFNDLAGFSIRIGVLTDLPANKSILNNAHDPAGKPAGFFV